MSHTGIGSLRYPLNAVVFRGTKPLTAHERMKRYYQAVVAYPTTQLSLRANLGAAMRDAWKAGKRPNLQLIRRAIRAATLADRP